MGELETACLGNGSGVSHGDGGHIGIGAVEDEMISISENPLLLRTIEDLNQIGALDRRSRGNKKFVTG